MAGPLVLLCREPLTRPVSREPAQSERLLRCAVPSTCERCSRFPAYHRVRPSGPTPTLYRAVPLSSRMSRSFRNSIECYRSTKAITPSRRSIPLGRRDQIPLVAVANAAAAADPSEAAYIEDVG